MPYRTRFVPLAVSLFAALPLHAQQPGAATPTVLGETPWDSVVPLPAIGSLSEEAARLSQLRGQAPTSGFLLRTPSAALAGADSAGGRHRISLLYPEAQAGWNSDIPFGLNDGPVWAGKGLNTSLRAGLTVRAGPVRLVLAPELLYARNADFRPLIPERWDVIPHPYIPPWQAGEHSIDWPYRFGHSSLSSTRLGQSSLTVTAGPVAVGASTENLWWGPGIRNALVLSNQGGGFRHLFARTARPLRTPLGQVEAQWISGALHDSRWYGITRQRRERWRSLSAAAVVVSPSPTVSLGVARSVHTPAGGPARALAGGTRVFTRWSEERDPQDEDRFEQITALWGRVLIPRQGAELYAEWARTRLPLNLRGLLETPEHTQGYTLGLQWLRPAGAGDLRLQAEHTYVEESPTYAWVPNGSWYASAAIGPGYTHEGQLLGAAVGPGGSGQWLALDWLRGHGRAGAFLGRIRWAQDAYYSEPARPNRYLGYDVSMFGGVRGVLPRGPLRLEAEYTLQKRWNYLFQSRATGFADRFLTKNVVNHTVRIGASFNAPRLGPSR